MDARLHACREQALQQLRREFTEPAAKLGMTFDTLVRQACRGYQRQPSQKKLRVVKEFSQPKN
jgi:hypothetical protein